MKIDRLIYNQNWNIGFSNITQDTLIDKKKICNIQWMKHSYKDRFFADPFIFKVTDDEIIVFAEECLFEKPNGCIVELIVDKRTKRLKKRYLLLESNTHLSYPAIFFCEDKVYVYPENGTSGSLSLYTYDEESHKLINPIIILDEATADSTILEFDGKFYLVATKYPETQENVFLYEANTINGPYFKHVEVPFSTNKRFSRPAGDFFYVNGDLYRPAQDCIERYGAGLSIMKVTCLKGTLFEEKYEFGIYPSSFRYNLGIHTINFHEGCCVIDGQGYLYPIIGRLYYSALVRLMVNILKFVLHRK